LSLQSIQELNELKVLQQLKELNAAVRGKTPRPDALLEQGALFEGVPSLPLEQGSSMKKDKNIHRSEEEQDPERPSDRQSSIYKDKSLFNPEAGRRQSVDAEEEVADYHAVINGLAEPYDRFLWRGSVCISAAPGQRHATWHPVKIKLDTGSDLNIISSRVLQSLKYQSTYDDPEFKAAITLDSAHVQEFDKRVSLSFTFDLWPFTLYETFYVKEGAQIDVLI
jgi:hypothetical protein